MYRIYGDHFMYGSLQSWENPTDPQNPVFLNSKKLATGPLSFGKNGQINFSTPDVRSL